MSDAGSGDEEKEVKEDGSITIRVKDSVSYF